MRLLVHDYSGHPFQAELSRSLAGRGHTVRHSTCASHVSGKGDLSNDSSGRLTYSELGRSPLHKQAFIRRMREEVGFGLELIRETRRFKPDAVVLSNVPIPMQVAVSIYFSLVRMPWLYWMQDVQGVAVRSFAGRKLGRAWLVVAFIMGVLERMCARSSAHIVVIADAFLDVHRKWGTIGKTSVVPNWAPLEEIKPVKRDNDWALEHGLRDVVTILYSGTLGLKHNPELLVELTARVRDLGHDARLVVVSEGAAVPVIRDAAAKRDVPAQLMPFQPYERLSEVLGSGDVLVVLLDESAGAFSVPSKTMSYMCAGRPILGLMPKENSAAALLIRSDCAVLPPRATSLDAAANWIDSVVANREKWNMLADNTRALAETEFSLKRSTDSFETILRSILEPEAELNSGGAGSARNATRSSLHVSRPSFR
ncbi:MAG: glycosyltransferase family 4 protein [Nocardiaceae bacterium]|nr:glycosyltransferase family 4 protein [Nocardiaceae bacterium]